jgi:hypothetical protein
MSPWICAVLIATAGGFGGVVNALFTDNGFALPRYRRGVWCPGVIGNIMVGTFAALSSWSFYGSGAAVELGRTTESTLVSLRLSALAGAFLVGVVGAKWITNEADKQLLKESVKVAGSKQLTPQQCEQVVKGSARQVLDRVEAA